METYADPSSDWFETGGFVQSQSLGEKLIADGWAPEVLSRDEHGYVQAVWWPPHIAQKRRFSRTG